MRQAQIITNSNPIQTPVLNFRNAPNAAAAETGNCFVEPSLDARCDICADSASATRTSLEERGWGLYDTFAFCPAHEEMI